MKAYDLAHALHEQERIRRATTAATFRPGLSEWVGWPARVRAVVRLPGAPPCVVLDPSEDAPRWVAGVAVMVSSRQGRPEWVSAVLRD